MLRGIWGDDERFKETYWSRFQDMYFAGDGAKKDDDGDLWLLGRVDDVMLVSGHNISTTEVESALVSHPKVAEAAVVGATDPTTGQAIVAFVIPRGGVDPRARPARRSSRSCATTSPRSSARSPSPARSCSSPSCRRRGPGKIMRRLLRDVAENREPRRRHHPAGLDRDGPDLAGPAVRQVRGLTAPPLEPPGRRRSPPARGEMERHRARPTTSTAARHDGSGTQRPHPADRARASSARRSKAQRYPRRSGQARCHNGAAPTTPGQPGAVSQKVHPPATPGRPGARNKAQPSRTAEPDATQHCRAGRTQDDAAPPHHRAGRDAAPPHHRAGGGAAPPSRTDTDDGSTAAPPSRTDATSTSRTD